MHIRAQLCHFFSQPPSFLWKKKWGFIFGGEKFNFSFAYIPKEFSRKTIYSDTYHSRNVKRELPKSKNTKSDIGWKGNFHPNHKLFHQLSQPSIINFQYGKDLKPTYKQQIIKISLFSCGVHRLIWLYARFILFWNAKDNICWYNQSSH